MAEPLRREVRVRCSIEHAFEVFTARIDLWWPPGHRRFETSQLHLEAAVGGRFFERSSSGEEAKLGEVIRCEPPHHISYTWFPGALDKPTQVDVTFAAAGEETIVNVVHSEAESGLGSLWFDRMKLFQRGWEHVLAAFCSATLTFKS